MSGSEKLVFYKLSEVDFREHCESSITPHKSYSMEFV